jgi:hypothetical protein
MPILDKFKITEYSIKANLKEGTQILITEYLPELIKDDKVYSAKLGIKIIAPADDSNTARLSFRMEHPEQVRILIMDIMKAYFYFLKQKNIPLDEGYLSYMFDKESRRILQEVKRL